MKGAEYSLIQNSVMIQHSKHSISASIKHSRLEMEHVFQRLFIEVTRGSKTILDHVFVCLKWQLL